MGLSENVLDFMSANCALLRVMTHDSRTTLVHTFVSIGPVAMHLYHIARDGLHGVCHT